MILNKLIIQVLFIQFVDLIFYLNAPVEDPSRNVVQNYMFPSGV